MKLIRWLTVFVSYILVALPSPTLATEFISTVEATDIIELYTSESCSSCPPADFWLSQLKTDPGLFKNFIPFAYHVDYWNQLGWKDRFSDQAYSARQYKHHQTGNISQVYTPGIVVNNSEWRGLLRGKTQWRQNNHKTGILKINIKPGIEQISISFSPINDLSNQLLTLYAAVLGMNLSTEIKSGENRGRLLEHDFVVLNNSRQNVSICSAKKQHWQVAMPNIPDKGQMQNVIVVWLENPETQQIIQATGGYLEQ